MLLPSTSVNVSVLITGTDNHGITGYLISESSITPGVSSPWISVNSTKSLSQSVSFTLSNSEGEKKKSTRGLKMTLEIYQMLAVYQ